MSNTVKPKDRPYIKVPFWCGGCRCSYDGGRIKPYWMGTAFLCPSCVELAQEMGLIPEDGKNHG